MKFDKYHGCGNDFVIVMHEELIDYSVLAQKICNRHVGIGADGLIVVKKEPLEMILFNADGSEATMCGNGIRCFAQYCYDNQIVRNSHFVVKTKAGDMPIEMEEGNYLNITVDLGKVEFDPTYTKVDSNVLPFFDQPVLTISGEIPVDTVYLGTVHTIVWVSTLEAVLSTTLGQEICHYPTFKEQTNVNFVKVVDKHNLIVRTYERGVGWTMACGTGCGASFAVGHLKGKCADKVRVHLDYGMLEYYIQNEHIIMKGPAKKVMEGNFVG